MEAVQFDRALCLGRAFAAYLAGSAHCPEANIPLHGYATAAEILSAGNSMFDGRNRASTTHYL